MGLRFAWSRRGVWPDVRLLFPLHRVKSAGVVCDDCRVISVLVRR